MGEADGQDVVVLLGHVAEGLDCVARPPAFLPPGQGLAAARGGWVSAAGDWLYDAWQTEPLHRSLHLQDAAAQLSTRYGIEGSVLTTRDKP